MSADINIHEVAQHTELSGWELGQLGNNGLTKWWQLVGVSDILQKFVDHLTSKVLLLHKNIYMISTQTA